MPRRFRVFFFATLLGLFAAPLIASGPAAAAIAPPWCGTPEPDAAANLPDGSSPAQPLGSFPHIPYYAIGCTLSRHRRSQRRPHDGRGRRRPPPGRDLYHVVINALETGQQRKDYRNWRDIHEDALDDPKYAQRQIESFLQVRRRLQDPDLHPGRDPRERVRGRRRVDGADRAARDDARTAPIPRSTRSSITWWSSSTRSRTPTAASPASGERQQLRPQPRLPDAVAVRDEGLGLDHEALVRARHARPARLRHADARSRRRRSRTTRASSTTSG